MDVIKPKDTKEQARMNNSKGGEQIKYVRHKLDQLKSAKTMQMFITDNGGGVKLRYEDGTVQVLERYGVWGDAGRGKPEVLACGNNLDVLRERFGTDIPVYTM